MTWLFLMTMCQRLTIVTGDEIEPVDSAGVSVIPEPTNRVLPVRPKSYARATENIIAAKIKVAGVNE
jgi:hypothetical protein